MGPILPLVQRRPLVTAIAAIVTAVGCILVDVTLVVVLQINRVNIAINAINFCSRLTQLKIVIAMNNFYFFCNQLTIIIIIC